jgi:hypothetical protein
MSINIFKQRRFLKVPSFSFSWLKETQSYNDVNKETNVNPFFNPQTASLRRELEAMQSEIKTWQAQFKSKHGRKPTLEEMNRDNEIGPILKSLENQKNAIKTSIQRFIINKI